MDILRKCQMAFKKQTFLLNDKLKCVDVNLKMFHFFCPDYLMQKFLLTCFRLQHRESVSQYVLLPIHNVNRSLNCLQFLEEISSWPISRFSGMTFVLRDISLFKVVVDHKTCTVQNVPHFYPRHTSTSHFTPAECEASWPAVCDVLGMNLTNTKKHL